MSFKVAGVVTDSASRLGTGDFLIEVPPSVVDGDVMFMLGMRRTSTGDWVVPVGWTHLFLLTSSSSNRAQTFLAYRVADNEPTEYNLGNTSDNMSPQSGVILAYDEIDVAGGIFDVTPTIEHRDVFNNEPNAPHSPITTISDNSLIVTLQWLSNDEVVIPRAPDGFELDFSHNVFMHRNLFAANAVQGVAGLVSPSPWRHDIGATLYGDGVTTIMALKSLAPPVPTITDITTTRLGEAATATMVNVTDLSASVVTATFNGVSVALSNLTANTLDFIVPSSLLRLGFSYRFVVTVDGDESLPTITLMLPPTGYDFIALAAISTHSFLFGSVYTGNAGGDVNNIGVGDQIVYQSTTIEAGTDVAISDRGIVTMRNGVADNVTQNQTISWFYLETQEAYLASNTATLTLLAPVAEPVITPTLAITASDLSLTIGETSVLTFAFSENVTGFDASYIAVTGGTIGALSGSGDTYTATFTPPTEFSGAVTINVANGTFVDADSNTGTGDSLNITIATVTPIPTPLVPQGIITVGLIVVSKNSAIVPFTYSDSDQTGFEYRFKGVVKDIGNINQFVISSLTASTPYQVEVRAINATGEGAWSAVDNFITSDQVVIFIPGIPNPVYSFPGVSGQDKITTKKIDVYAGRNKPYMLLIMIDGVEHDLSSVTDVGIVIDGTEYKSSKGFMSFGEKSVTFKLGSIPTPPKTAKIGSLIFYDANHPLGEPIFTERTNCRLLFEFVRI